MPRIILIYTQSSETEEEKPKGQLLYRFAHPPVTRPIFQRENAILNIHEAEEWNKSLVFSKAWETIGMAVTSWNFLCIALQSTLGVG